MLCEKNQFIYFNKFEKHNCFINSAYLSELWAVSDLVRFKNNFPLYWNSGREKQLQDEVVHANLLLKALKNATDLIVVDTQFSMQERLYKKYFNLQSASSPEEHCIIHEMNESRAKWIYQTYLRRNDSSPYASILRKILKDEETHFNIDQTAMSASRFSKNGLTAIDRLLFRAYLPSKFGNQIFDNSDFWPWYFKNADFISISK